MLLFDIFSIGYIGVKLKKLFKGHKKIFLKFIFFLFFLFFSLIFQFFIWLLVSIETTKGDTLHHSTYQKLQSLIQEFDSLQKIILGGLKTYGSGCIYLFIIDIQPIIENKNK